MTVTYERHKYKKGQKVTLDSIYIIQGLGGGMWWDHICGVGSNDVIITKDIEITIKVKV